MIFSGYFGNFFHFTSNASNTFLCRIRKHPRIGSHCRSCFSHNERRHFLLGDSYTELNDIIHIIRSKYQANRHLLAFGSDYHRTFGSFKKSII